MLSQAVALGFRKRSIPPLGGTQRVSQAAIQAAMLRGALERNSQSISPQPDPLPPAPVLGLVELGLIAIAAALGETVQRFGQLWGSSNSRPGQAAARVDLLKNYPIGAKSVSGRTEYSITGGTVTYNATSRSPFAPDAVPLRLKTLTFDGGSYLASTFTVTVEIRNYAAPIAVFYNNGIEVGFTFLQTQAGISVDTPILRVDAVLTAVPVDAGPTVALTGDPLSAFVPDPVAFLPLTLPGPLQLASIPPAAAEAAAVQQAPVAQTQTPPAEAGPLVPVVEAAGALAQLFETVRAVVYVPAALPAPLRAPAEQTQQTTTAGALVPRAAAAVPTTANDARRYGSRTVTAQGVRPDVAAIAEEVGRIEQKVGELLSGMDRTPVWLDYLTGELLSQLLQGLLDALVVDVPATTYGFVAPCDKDENGDPVEWSAEIEAADYQPALVARLDAIAEALGVLKGWKQPICRTTPPRSNVTVTAYEYDPEA